MKRRATNPNEEDSLPTPTGKKLRSMERQSGRSAGQKPLKSGSTPPVFVVEEDQPDNNMEAPTQAKSPKPPSAEEFRAMLRDGLANVAKREQVEQMMTQIRTNTQALGSLEKRMEETTQVNEKCFRQIEDRIEAGPLPKSPTFDNSKSRL